MCYTIIVDLLTMVFFKKKNLLPTDVKTSGDEEFRTEGDNSLHSSEMKRGENRVFELA